jgi:hypothetical protein
VHLLSRILFFKDLDLFFTPQQGYDWLQADVDYDKDAILGNKLILKERLSMDYVRNVIEYEKYGDLFEVR